MAVNNVVLVGRLTNDPVVNTIGEENKVKQTKFTLAVDRPYKKQGEDRPEADFIKINAKRGSAEFAEKYFTKGKQVSVVGSIRTYSFQKDGQTVYDFCVEAEKLGFADSAYKGKGDIIVCLDESGSTFGENNAYGMAVAMVLYQLCRINKSNFALVHFASDIKTDFFPKDEVVSSQRILDCAETFLNGGTNFEKPLREAFALTSSGKMDKPDIIFITDGICNVSDAFLDLLEEFKADTGAKLTGILLDEGESFDFSLKKFADKIYRTSELLKDEIVDDVISDRT